MFVHGKYFYGNEISEYGQEHNRVDYRTLAKAFDGVLNNDIMGKTDGIIGYWEQESGFIDNTEEIDELDEKIDELNESIEAYQEQIEALEDDIEEKNEDYINGQIEIIEEKIEELEEKIAELEEEKQELENEQDYPDEVFQWYIVDDNGAEILKEINEIVYYNDELDMYLWGVTHWGTSWDYVLTDIPCNVPYEDEAE